MELLYQYENYLSNYSETTKETYLVNVKEYLKYLRKTYGEINSIIICNVSRSDIYNYIAYMDGLSKNTKKIRLYSIKNFYSYLKLEDNLFEDIKLYNLDKKMPRILSSLQCKTLLNYYPDKRNKLIIYLFLTTGIRLSELANILIKDIDFKNKQIKIMCKGRVERNVFINEKCTRMLSDYTKNRSGRVFEISKGAIQYVIKKAIRDLGLTGSVHTLRHSFATMMYQETHDILLVQKLLGHKSINSTQIYTHIVAEEIKKAVESNPLAEVIK